MSERSNETPAPAPSKKSSLSKLSQAAPEQQFLRLMSHEMRTPLNGVIGMLSLLSRTRMDGAQRAYAEAAQKSAEHLLGLVNDLLDYARLEAGALEFDPAPVDLESLTRSVAELLSPRAHDRGLEIMWSVASDAPDIMADEGRLRQVLFNLAGNAVKFTDCGGVHIAVERCGGTEQKPRIAFTIDDTGPGVPVEARARIFEEFGHADHSDAARHDGAGLGLAVVSKLAQAMKGKVTVTDRPDGAGARFRFEAQFGIAGAAPRSRPLTGQSVQIMSADPMLRRCITMQVEASGGLVADKAEVVLVDHALAGDGARVPLPSERAIIMLKPSERDMIASYKRGGFHGYLIKPLRRESLAERILVAAPRAVVAPLSIRHLEDDRLAVGSFKGVRVLLVEDNPVGQLLAKTLLRREGCMVQTAADGHEALEAARTNLFDIIFMDMRMPRMDGVTASRQLRALGHSTPIVALTANAYAEDRAACLEAGMNDHLTKPLEIDALRMSLARWTNGNNRAKLTANN